MARLTLEEMKDEALYDPKEVATSFPNLKLVRLADWKGEWNVELYWDSASKTFFEKGPFARWGSTAMRVRRDLKSIAEWEGQQDKPGPDGVGKIVVMGEAD